MKKLFFTLVMALIGFAANANSMLVVNANTNGCTLYGTWVVITDGTSTYTLSLGNLPPGGVFNFATVAAAYAYAGVPNPTSPSANFEWFVNNGSTGCEVFRVGIYQTFITSPCSCVATGWTANCSVIGGNLYINCM